MADDKYVTWKEFYAARMESRLGLIVIGLLLGSRVILQGLTGDPPWWLP